MGILGGLSLNAIFLIDTLPLSTAEKAAVSALFITAMELTAGIILNIYLKMDIWDYSKMFLNFLGQISVFYSAVWFILSFVILKIIHKIA